MEAYRDLFRCKYPDLFELVFAYKRSSAPDSIFDDTAPARVYEALVAYQNAKTKCEQLEESGRDALLTMDLRKLSKTIAPDLQNLIEQDYNLFQRFPDRAYRIDWDRVSHIKSTEVFSVIHTRVYDQQGEIDLADARDNCGIYRKQAEYTISQIIREISKYEHRLVLLDTDN